MDGIDGSKMFSVTYPSHSQAMLQGLWNFFQARHGTDVCLQLNGRSIPAHRLILDAFLQSTTIQAYCAELSDVDDVDPGMEEDGILDAVLEFLYTGSVSLPVEQRGKLLEAATELEFQLLIDAIESSEMENVEVENLVGVKIEIGGRCYEIAGTGYESAESCNEVSQEGEFQALAEASEGTELLSVSSLTEECKERGKLKRKKVGEGPRVYRCSHCEFETTKRHTYHYHLKSIHRVTSKGVPVEKFKCQECDYEAMYLGNYNQHLQSKHPKWCVSCCQAFGTEELLSDHVKAEHLQDVKEVADSVTSSKGDDCNAPQSSKGEDTEGVLKCPHCELRTTAPHVYRRHLRTAHGVTSTAEIMPKYRCLECDFVSSSVTRLRYHALLHAKEKKFKCPYCDHVAADNDGLTIHMCGEHKDESGPVSCPTCGRQCTTAAALLIHNRIHAHEKPFKCEQCELSFNEKGNLTRHVGFVHGDSRFTCETCGHHSSSQCHLRVHQRVHSKETPFACTRCARSFKDKRRLDLHVSIVHGVGAWRYTCENCEKRCHSMAALDIHRQTHTKERPLKCPHCEESFVGKVALRKHLCVVHSIGSDRYACKICGDWYGSPSALMMHVRKHTRERPFKCQLCDYASVQSSSLKGHIRNVHKFELNKEKLSESV